MLFKQMLVYGTHYIQFGFPYNLGRKCVSSRLSNFRLCFQKNKINFINSNFCSSYEGPPEDQSHNSSRNRFNNDEKVKIKKWIDMIRFEGGRVPQYISEEQYSELISLEDEILRLKYINFLSSKEHEKMKAKISKEKMKEIKRQKYEERRNRPKGHIEYGLWRNTMFAKTSKRDSKNLQRHKLVNAMLFNQPIVLDLGFYDYMERREAASLAEQVSFAISMNRLSSEPFNLTLCNVDFDSRKFHYIYKMMPNLSKPNFPINVTSESYLDIFPKEKLVYLIPNAKDEMKEFDHEAIYIIGGLVDLRGSEPLTYAKAKKENIKMMKLPITKYHLVRHERFNLGIHVMVNILLDLQKHGDFKKAFKNIPKRHLFTGDDNHRKSYNTKFSKF